MKKREIELDILRLLALMAVIFTHASGIEAESAVSKNIMTFMIATVTWHVPVFVMISGRFFLDPERMVTAVKVRKAIGRMIVAFVFWNIIYQIYYILTDAYTGLNWKGILSQALMGPYHFWYLFMLVGLYAVVPFLRKITQDKNLMEYFIVLFLIFEFLTMYGPRLPLIGDTVNGMVGKTDFHLALGYSGYYILGFYLYRYPLSGKKEKGLYVLGVLMLAFTGLATVWKTVQGAAGEEWFSKYLMPNVIIEAAAIYTFFVNRVSRISISSRVSNVIAKLAEYSFGAYLIHALVLELVSKLNVELYIRNVILAVLLVVVLVFIVSIGMTMILRKIPKIGKKIT